MRNKSLRRTNDFIQHVSKPGPRRQECSAEGPSLSTKSSISSSEVLNSESLSASAVPGFSLEVAIIQNLNKKKTIINFICLVRVCRNLFHIIFAGCFKCLPTPIFKKQNKLCLPTGELLVSFIPTLAKLARRHRVLTLLALGRSCWSAQLR